jgi:hypothetical protein
VQDCSVVSGACDWWRAHGHMLHAAPAAGGPGCWLDVALSRVSL